MIWRCSSGSPPAVIAAGETRGAGEMSEEVEGAWRICGSFGRREETWRILRGNLGSRLP